MAGSAKFSLKLLIDDEKNKVVLAEACQGFVDVLFSLLTLPMGTIARLLEKHQKLPQVLSCYGNLNKSVANLGVDNFETEACKTMFINPKSAFEIHCRRLKMNMDVTEHSKFYVCPFFYKNELCRSFSNFTTSKCMCGQFMTKKVNVPEQVQARNQIIDDVDGIFVSCRSSFIVTDDMRVRLNSIGGIVNVLKELGYKGFSNMREMILEVGFEEVVVLLGCLFSTDSALTFAFLRKDNMALIGAMSLSPPVQVTKNIQPSRVLNVKVFVRKLDKKILYAESSEDFIDSLITFLVLPLLSACSFSSDNTILQCVRNMSGSEGRRALTYGLLPGYYACRNSLLDIQTLPLPEFECLIPKGCTSYYDFSFKGRSTDRSHLLSEDTFFVRPNNPKDKLNGTIPSGGFLKMGTKFIVSDDLFITAMNSSSTIELLKKNQVDDISDIEEHAISISKTELISILRASLISSSALTNGLSNFLMRKPKEET